MKSKLFSLILAIVCLLNLSSCELGNQRSNASRSESISESSSQLSSTVEKESYSISLVSVNYVDSNCGQIHAGCLKAVADLEKQGIEINFSIDRSVHLEPTQWEILEDVIDDEKDQKDAILLIPEATDGYKHLYDKARDKGIKTVLLAYDIIKNNACDASYLSNDFNDGKLAAEQMIKKLETKGIDSGKIELLNVNEDAQSMLSREHGFRTEFQGKGYDLVDTFYTNGDGAIAQEHAKEILESDKNKEIVGIVCFYPLETYGITTEIEKADRFGSVVFTTFDNGNYYTSEYDYDYIIDTFKTGAIDISINTDPYQMGYQGLMGAVELLRGNKINPKKVYIPPIVVTKDNYEEYFKEIDRQIKEAYE